MKGNPQVIAGLQEAANLEGSMMLQMEPRGGAARV